MRWLPLVAGIVALLVVMALDLRLWVRRILLTAIVFGVPTLFYRADIDRWAFEKSTARVATVDAGNEFTVRGANFIRRHLTLADTALPPDQDGRNKAKAALEELIAGRDVNLTFTLRDRGEPEPWRVQVRLGQTEVNRLMVERGYLSGSGPLAGATAKGTATGPPPAPAASQASPTPTTASPAAPAAPAPAASQTSAAPAAASPAAPPTPQAAPPPAPPAAPKSTGSVAFRYALWVGFGWLGATAVGLVLNRKPQGVVVMIGCLALAGYEIFQCVHDEISVIPPVVGLGVMFLFGGPFAKTQRWYEEQQRK